MRPLGLYPLSLALAEQIRTIDRSRLSNYIGHIDGATQNAVDNALAVCIGLENKRPPKGEMLVLTLYPRCEAAFTNSDYLLVKKGWQEIKEDCDFCKEHAKGLTFGIFNLDGRERNG